MQTTKKEIEEGIAGYSECMWSGRTLRNGKYIPIHNLVKKEFVDWIHTYKPGVRPLVSTGLVRGLVYTTCHNFIESDRIVLPEGMMVPKVELVWRDKQ